MLLLALVVVVEELKITDLSNEISSLNNEVSSLNQQLTPTGGIRVVSAEMASLITPAGPTVTITLQNEMGQNVTSLEAVLELSMNNYTYGFPGVSLSNPLKQGQSASDTETLINGGFSTGEAYPLVIEGTTQGLNFTCVTSTEITTGSTSTSPSTSMSPSTSGGNSSTGLGQGGTPFLYPVYLTSDDACTENGYGVPCGDSSLSDAYVFNCAAAAASASGCTELVTSTLIPSNSYLITIRFPYVNQTGEPYWANCLFEVEGDTAPPYAYCVMVNSTAFIMAWEGGPPA